MVRICDVFAAVVAILSSFTTSLPEPQGGLVPPSAGPPSGSGLSPVCSG